MKNIFVIFVLIAFSILTTDLKAKTKKVSNNASKIILHDGMFGDGLPNRFEIDSSRKNYLWGWGNWNNSNGIANMGFAQTGQGRVLTEKGMLPKKVLKSWSVENYKLGKKKGFKSSGYRALVQLVEINNKKCVVIISRFGPSSGDDLGRVRSTVDGYICKNSGEITIDEGMNFLHCVELKGEETNFVGRKIDDKCVKKEIAKKVIKKSSEKKRNALIYCQKSNGNVYTSIHGTCVPDRKISEEEYLEIKNENKIKKEQNEDIETKLTKLKSLFEKGLITKEEYDKKRKEILDEM